MATKQVINFAGYLAAGSMLLLLQACSPSDSAPYYLNKSSTSQSTESTDTQSSTTVPATTTTTTTAPATSTPPPPPPPMNPCTVYTGQSYPHGSTLYGYCRIGDAAGNLICFNTVSIAYYTCNNGKWIPQ